MFLHFSALYDYICWYGTIFNYFFQYSKNAWHIVVEACFLFKIWNVIKANFSIFFYDLNSKNSYSSKDNNKNSNVLKYLRDLFSNPLSIFYLQHCLRIYSFCFAVCIIVLLSLLSGDRSTIMHAFFFLDPVTWEWKRVQKVVYSR